MSANLFVAGRIIWRAELKQTKNGRPMRSVLIATDEDNMPPVRALVFGDDAEHAAVGDFMSVEGSPEITVFEKNGETKPAVSMMARWSRLTGHGGQRQRKSAAAKRGEAKNGAGQHQEAIDAFASPGPPASEQAPFDDEIPF